MVGRPPHTTQPSLASAFFSATKQHPYHMVMWAHRTLYAAHLYKFWAPKNSVLQISDKVETLMCYFYQTGSVGTPDQAITKVHTQVPDAGQHWCAGKGVCVVVCPLWRELASPLFLNFNAKFFFFAPTLRMFHLLTAARLILVGDASNHTCAICRLHSLDVLQSSHTQPGWIKGVSAPQP